MSRASISSEMESNPLLEDRPQPILCRAHGDLWTIGLLNLMSKALISVPGFKFMLPDHIETKLAGPTILQKCNEQGTQNRHVIRGCGHLVELSRCNPFCVSFIREKTGPPDTTCPRCICDVCREIYAKERAYRSIEHLHGQFLQVKEAIYGGDDEDLAEANYETILESIREAIQPFPDLKDLQTAAIMGWMNCQRELYCIEQEDHIRAAEDFARQVNTESKNRLAEAKYLIALNASEIILAGLFQDENIPPDSDEADDMRWCLRGWFDDKDVYDHYLLDAPGGSRLDDSPSYVVNHEAAHDGDIQEWFPKQHLDWLVSFLPEMQKQRDIVKDAISIIIPPEDDVQWLTMRVIPVGGADHRVLFVTDPQYLLQIRTSRGPPRQR